MTLISTPVILTSAAIATILASFVLWVLPIKPASLVLPVPFPPIASTVNQLTLLSAASATVASTLMSIWPAKLVLPAVLPAPQPPFALQLLMDST